MRTLRVMPVWRLAGEDRLRPRAERLVDVELALERHHDVARVLREAINVVERRDDEALRLREDRHDAEHRRAAVVDLDEAAARLLLLRLLREDVERLVEVEEDLRAVALDRRVVARLAARGRVVRHVAGDLAVRLEHADEGEDLELADHRDVVPLLLRRRSRRSRGTARSSERPSRRPATARRSRGTRPWRR